MHAGQFSTLTAVIEHYNRAPAAPGGHTELEPLGLSAPRAPGTSRVEACNAAALFILSPDC
jgi:hypothetical protein